MVKGAEKIILAARYHIGLSENPRGSNDGEDLRHVLRNTGFEPGQPWCMYFAIACLLEAFGGRSNLPKPVLNTGSCQAAAEYAKVKGGLSDFPATGCIFLLFSSTGHFHHAGIVTSVNEAVKTITTIEGNSNDDGSTEGWEVVAHRRETVRQKYIIW